MPQKAPRIERKFAFDMPLSMFPNVLERLRGTPARAEERVVGVAPSRLRERRREFVTRLEDVPDEAIGRSAHHPRLQQPMRILDLMVFAAQHDGHHLARIMELLRTIRG